MEFPGAEERGPVKGLDQIGQVPILENVNAGLLRRGSLFREVGLVRIGPRIGQADVLDATKMVWVATALLSHSAQHSPAPLPSWPDLEDLEPDIRTAGGPPPH